MDSRERRRDLRAMFQANPDAERKIPTTVKLTHGQRRRAEQKARELGMTPHAFYQQAITAATEKQTTQSS